MADHRQLVTIGSRSTTREEDLGARDPRVGCHSAASTPSGGIPGNLELEARGWQRRYLADEHRAHEALELYSSLGFEVRAETLEPAHFASHCGDCSASVCASYVLVYTRKRTSMTPPAAEAERNE